MAMKRFFNWQVWLGLALIILSAAVYFTHYLIFRDTHHIFIYLIGDVGFAFLEVLLVTIIIHRLLVFREKNAMLKKLNMVIGAFFSEVGMELLSEFFTFDPKVPDIAKKLVIDNKWSKKKFLAARNSIKHCENGIDSRKGDLEGLRTLLVSKRQFLLGLLENPNLLEHESFTDLLWAVFHLTEELTQRRGFSQLPETDYQHLSVDIKRAYSLLISEWLDYMRHLKSDYPYLFSLAIRTNPFDESASVEVK